MKHKLYLLIVLMILVSLPVLAQEKLYPVRSSPQTILTSDRSAVVVERAFQHKVTIGHPTDDRAAVADTRADIVALWVRVQNVAQRPMKVDISKFTSTDDKGRMYRVLMPDEAGKRILAEAPDASLSSRTLRGISLGKAGNVPSAEQLTDDVQRYSLHSGEIAAGAAKEGLIYFERPQQKKFILRVVLGDLWSQPLVFSTEKQK
jgi:hypothetical protein